MQSGPSGTNPDGFQQQPWQQQQPYPGAQPQWGAQNFGGMPPQKKKKTGLIVGIAIGLIVLIGLGVGGFFLFKGDDKKPSADPAPGKPGNSAPAGPAQLTSSDDLMDHIRKTGPCEMHDTSVAKKYGAGATDTDTL